jgi:DNA-binding CsgD family transcriptional regulator
MTEIRHGRADGLTLDRLAILADFAGGLAGEFALQPLLERILSNAVELLGCRSGSICTVDEASQTYRKEVDLGVGCRSGEVFPLDEGVTGAVVRAGGPVSFARYSEVPRGHVSDGDSRAARPVIGIPIRMKDTLLGAFVVFGATEGESFDDDDARLLELFAIHAAVAIENSRLHAASLASREPQHPDAAPAWVGSLTPRERQVRALVERGRADKQIAAELGISAKTVEKHVGTIMRKAGAHNRTELASFASLRAS